MEPKRTAARRTSGGLRGNRSLPQGPGWDLDRAPPVSALIAALSRGRAPKASDALGRCPLDVGATATHGPSDRPEGPDCSVSSGATRAMALPPRLLVARVGARSLLVPRLRSDWMVPEPRAASGVRDAVGRTLDQPKSTRGPRAVHREPTEGDGGHAFVPVPGRTCGLFRVRSRSID